MKSRTHSPARSTSARAAGSALMLGMASHARRSSSHCCSSAATTKTVAVRRSALAPVRRLAAVFDYAERRRRLSERMRAEGVDLLFLGPSADLEYLTGAER